MKKSLLLLTTMAALLASCGDNQKLTVEPEHAIDFKAYTGKTTKAAIDSNTGLADAGGFLVWGYKTPTASVAWTSASTIFNEQLVEAENGAYTSGNNTNWTYTPKKYWDINGTYKFYAAGPNDKTNIDIAFTGSNKSTGKITISNAQSLVSTNEAYNDYVILRNAVTRNAGEANGTDNVDFDFNHVMSKVLVKLKKEDTNHATVKVTALSMTGWNANNGNFAQSDSYSAAAKDNAEWSIDGTSAGTATFTLPEGGMTLTTTATAPVENEFWIMVPQSFAANALTFNVTYTLTYSDGITDTQTKTGTIAAHKWATDCVTTYTLTIAPAAIQFDVKEFSWTESDTQDLTVE